MLETEAGHQLAAARASPTRSEEAEFWRIKDELIGKHAKVKYHETGTKTCHFSLFIHIRPEEDMTK